MMINLPSYWSMVDCKNSSALKSITPMKFALCVIPGKSKKKFQVRLEKFFKHI